MIPLAQPPRKDDNRFDDWMYRMWKRISATAGIAWALIDKTGASLKDIPDRQYKDLQYIPAPPIIHLDYEQDESLFVPPPQNYDFDHVTFPANKSIGTLPASYTLTDLMNYEWSAGVVNGCAITDNGNGTVSIAPGVGVIRPSAGSTATLYGIGISAQANISLTDQSTNYIYIDYNAGAPLFSVSTSITSFNCMDKCIAYMVHRDGTLLHIVDAREQNVDGNRKTRQLFLKFSKFIHSSNGTSIGANGLAITLTSGSFFFMLQELPHIAFDTSVVGTANANVFTLWYRNGAGGWTSTASQKVVSTTVYDNNTGTPVTLGNNKFGATWFYIINDSPSELHAVMGEVEYPNQSSAVAASPPSSVPSIVDGLGVLVGFVVYEKSVVSFNNVLSSFSQTFTSSAATNHNGLAGLQGGAINEYYHLSSSQNTQLNQLISKGSIGIPGMDGEDGESGYILLQSQSVAAVGSGLTHPQVLTRVSFRM